MLSRRGFLGALAGAAAAIAFDPERALWVPGARTISVPAAPVGNIFLSFDDLEEYYIRPALIEMARAIDRDALKFMRFPRGVKIGDTINVRMPRRFVGWDPTGELRENVVQFTRFE